MPLNFRVEDPLSKFPRLPYYEEERVELRITSFPFDYTKAISIFGTAHSHPIAHKYRTEIKP